MQGERLDYITIDCDWTPAICPSCGKIANFHGFLLGQPPPASPATDRRQRIGEVFMHTRSRDCVVHFPLAAEKTGDAIVRTGWQALPEQS